MARPKKIKPKEKPQVEDSAVMSKDKEEPKEIENWADKVDSDVYIHVEKMYPTIRKAYENREEANEAIEEYWKIFNAEPDDNAMYAGNSKCYIPAVRDAITARAKRTLKQLFPTKYSHVEAVGSDGQDPGPQLALLEHYIRTTKLKSVCRSILLSGDVTGQWNICMDWKRSYRNISGVVRRNPILNTAEGSEVEVQDPTEEVDEEKDEEILVEGPDISDFATEDLVVIPPTCNNLDDADISCLKLRMSKAAIQKMVMSDRKGTEKINPQKKRTSDAGIRTEGTFKYALIYWAQAYVEFEKGKKSLADIYFAGEKEILGIIKAPQWGQKRSVISAPVDRISGSFNGKSKVDAVKFLQWNLNDFWNMGQDSAMYSLLPVVMTDPEKNPNYAMMVFGLAAVWPVDP
ncbi:MAG: hypothetical protein B7Z62_09025, partial [Deltaproteobacteria bacterium 37-65-8]